MHGGAVVEKKKVFFEAETAFPGNIIEIEE